MCSAVTKKMERVRGRLKKFRYRFEQKIDQIPSCFKPKKDMPKLIYTVMDSRECESLLCQNYVPGELLHDQVKLAQRGRERLLSDVSFWKEIDVSDHGCTERKGNEPLWNAQHSEKEGPTIRVATFDVALFSLAPAIPPDHPATGASSAPDHFQQLFPAHYLSSESSVFSCKSKSTSSEASSGMTFFSNSRESNDSAETCAVLSHVSKPPQTFGVLTPCSLIGPAKLSPVKQASFDIRKAWRTSSLSAKTRAICHFKPSGGRSGINGPFYRSKLNPVFSFHSNSSKCLVDSLPRLFGDQVSCQDSSNPTPQAASTISVPDDVATPLCYTPVGSPGKEKTISALSCPTPLLLSNVIQSDERTPEQRSVTVPSGASSPATASSAVELSNSGSPQNNLASAASSALSSSIASPCSTNVLPSRECYPSRPSSEAEQHLLSILDILLEVDADIIALQEVKAEEERGMKPLSELAEALGMEYAYAESWAPDFGNAVLSRWPIKSASVQQIHDETDYRNVLKVVVSVPLAGDLHFYCTQLDHLDEDWRMKQIDSLTSMVPPNQPHILTGNLNALNTTDYSKARLDEIAELRKKNNKVPPRGDVMKKLIEEKHYTDARNSSVRLSSGVNSLQIKEETQGTCQYGTRVDYILGSQKLPFDFIPGSYSVVSSRGTSNHDLVMVDLQPHCHS